MAPIRSSLPHEAAGSYILLLTTHVHLFPLMITDLNRDYKRWSVSSQHVQLMCNVAGEIHTRSASTWKKLAEAS